ncbi:hypothetical protein DM01DRAFT_81328 [Hesseltinella vesiculosa]|uniref:Peptidase S28 n=1 Tax=Hesseltinella vesiculosa TaxID=101127 RepID=A0A1X2G3N5_9FUNG|nr:hypothetical protein DM01DRAFT_81328 [Hesseltinella vesiculosa]
MTQLITPLLFFLITVAQALHSPGYRFGLENRQRDTVKVDSKYGPFYFNQRVDHSSDNATTFPQRIWANADWYKPNGPVIFYNAGEVDADQTGRSNYVVNSSMALLARELNGVVIVLEHRFYGQSMPAPDFSTENLKTLTIQNSMEDMVNVIKTFQIPTLGRTLPPPETRWIVYGGSYSGNLAAWLHQAHPDLVYATVVSSAPVQLRMDFYEYYDPIIRYGPTYCIDALENVIRADRSLRFMATDVTNL